MWADGSCRKDRDDIGSEKHGCDSDDGMHGARQGFAKIRVSSAVGIPGHFTLPSACATKRRHTTKGGTNDIYTGAHD